MAPRIDEPFTPNSRTLFERDPAEARKFRDKAFADYEMANFGIDSGVTKFLTKVSHDYLMSEVSDPRLRDKLLPNYPAGCKRPLQSRTWFKTFDLPNVTLETTPIVEFTDRGLRTSDGVEHEVDTVIYGTGFKAADYLGSLEVYGRGGRRLHDDWRDGAEAYLGNDGAGLSEPVHPVRTEYQRCHLDHLHARSAGGVRSATARRTGGTRARRPSRSNADVHDAFNVEIQDAMTGKVWTANCNNYFRHPNGKVVTQFPYSGQTFADRIAKVTPEEFIWSLAAAPRVD